MAGDGFSYANFSNLQALEQLYASWLQDPASVDSSWRNFFEGMQFAGSIPMQGGETVSCVQMQVYALINGYRTYGHLVSSFDPIAAGAAEWPDELKLESYGFSSADLDSHVPTQGFLKTEKSSLRELVEVLKKIYCGSIGFEYMGFVPREVEKWFQERIESDVQTINGDEKRMILTELSRAEIFETFIHTKYVGQKRFSLEGAETLIPMLTSALNQAAEMNVSEVVLGMAHRGRLNVLANILGKSYDYIFHEFEDHYTPDLLEGTGDVKYHKGFVGEYSTLQKKKVKLLLSANPSHLESVDPVIEGVARALQEQKTDKASRKQVLPILIHGDASVAGQGVVYETMQLSRLEGYQTEGTLHIVINNQIGFTTLPKEGRSTRYCTDIAKTFSAPVMHVNAEDAEAAVFVAKLCIEFRQTFGYDVFIDLCGYRKYGHNETDEPFFTQPVQYRTIKAKKTIRDLYREQLIANSVLSEQEASKLQEEFKASLNVALEKGKALVSTPKSEAATVKSKAEISSVKSAVSVELCKQFAERLCTVPENFHLHPKIKKLLEERKTMVAGDPNKPSLDWAMGELLAYATLVAIDKVHVRLSGQDAQRGTFSHRHGILVDQEDAALYSPLAHLDPSQARFDIYNSPLSEFAVLGFELGYSLNYPRSLVLWEAQFGDFYNEAQVMVDQYIASGGKKWGQQTNITLLLPHGYEGQGPEHSSARIERFLQLSAENNLQLANCTSPAQLFHLLRRQALQEKKVPLIVFTPKALLRHPLMISPLSAFANGQFEEILDDPSASAKVDTLAFCSGKIYFELSQEREKNNEKGLSLVRIEQLYPLNIEKIRTILQKYSGMTRCVWVQEEPQNMGAWESIAPLIQEQLKGVQLSYIGRDRAASPAAGSYALHKQQSQKIVEKLFRK